MPTYTCTVRAGWLTPARKGAIARAVTTAHGEITGTPSCLAQVYFQEIAAGDHFIGGAPLEHDHVFVYGRIRVGRSGAVRDSLMQRLAADVAAAAGIDSFAVWVYLLELAPAVMLEFGHVLPRAGEEAAWTAALPADDRDRLERLERKLAS